MGQDPPGHPGSLRGVIYLELKVFPALFYPFLFQKPVILVEDRMRAIPLINLIRQNWELYQWG
jgi:hypothetical protein